MALLSRVAQCHRLLAQSIAPHASRAIGCNTSVGVNMITRHAMKKLHFLQFSRNCSSYQNDKCVDEKNILNKDKLILRGLLFHGYHGVLAEEKKLGQKFLVDVDAWLDLYKAGETDDLSDSVSYTDIYRVIEEIVQGPSRDLLESVAHAVAKAILHRFSKVEAVLVCIGKPHVAVRGVVDYLGVEIFRRR